MSIYFEAKIEAIIHGLYYIINKHHQGAVDLHKLMKIIFFSDVNAMNSDKNALQPIFGGSYLAMPYGPVPQTAYEIINNQIGEEHPMHFHQLMINQDFSLTRMGNKIVNTKYDQGSNFDYKFLSKNAIEFIDSSVSLLKGLSFSAVTELSHNHPAWSKAWEQAQIANSKSVFMEYENFYESEAKKDEALAIYS